MSSIAVTPGSGANVATVLDGSSVNHPVGVMEFLVSAAPTAVSVLNPLPVSLAPATSGGLSVASLVSAATTNATSAKASPGQLYGYGAFNNGAAARYLKVYDKASAPVVGTDTPILRVMIPGGGGANLTFPNGIQCSLGIAFALTANLADADATAVAVNECAVNLTFK